MTTNVKLTKVLEYLIKNDEEKAKELLHQVFIEKARAIHEELMSMEEEVQDEDLDETSQMDMDETFGGTGDEGKDLTREIRAMEYKPLVLFGANFALTVFNRGSGGYAAGLIALNQLPSWSIWSGRQCAGQKHTKA